MFPPVIFVTGFVLGVPSCQCWQNASTGVEAGTMILSKTNLLARFQDRLSLPLIAAPMFLVSGVELVAAACRNGVIGSFPTVNCRSPEQLDGWLGDIGE